MRSGDGNGRPRRGTGFRSAGDLLDKRIRKASESRGFAVQRVLTHWAEIAGPDVSAVARPVKVTYSAKGLGATLVVITSGANAPLLQMQLPRLQERINSAYGYAAISRIRITQTASDMCLANPVASSDDAGPAPEAKERAKELAAGIADPELRDALATIGAHVMTRG